MRSQGEEQLRQVVRCGSAVLDSCSQPPGLPPLSPPLGGMKGGERASRDDRAAVGFHLSGQVSFARLVVDSPEDSMISL